MSGSKYESMKWEASFKGKLTFAADADATTGLTTWNTNQKTGNIATRYSADGSTYEFISKADVTAVAGATAVAALGAAVALVASF